MIEGSPNSDDSSAFAMLRKIAARLASEFRTFGLRGLFRLVRKNAGYRFRLYLDGAFDRKYGTDTSGQIDTQRLGLVGRNATNAVYYEATPTGILDLALRSVGVPLEGYTFVDIGSGKGRTLLQAAMHPFKRVIGLELSLMLHEIACRNIRLFPIAARRCPIVEAVFCDATEYSLPVEPFVYFYTPFTAPVLEQVLARIGETISRGARDIKIVYYTTLASHVDLIKRQPFVTACKEFNPPKQRSRIVHRKLFVFDTTSIAQEVDGSVRTRTTASACAEYNAKTSSDH